MLGYCGINCLECRAYKGTVNGDETFLEQVAATYGKGAYQAHEWVCLGCGPHNQLFLARNCFSCEIRLCATERAVQSCAACDEFERCARLQAFIRTESPGLVHTMEWLRANYLAKYDQQAGH